MKEMNKKFFGTDGVRGEANKFPMTPEIILKLGMSAGSYFAKTMKEILFLLVKIQGYQAIC